MPEEDAFAVFATLMREYKFRGLFRRSMADLPLRLYQFDKLFAQTFPELHAHFQDLMVPVSSFASQWFLTLFGAVLPLPIMFRILDVLVLDAGPPTGSHGMLDIFRVGLAILGGNHDFLLMSSFEGILALFSPRGMRERYAGAGDADELMAHYATHGAAVTNKKLAKLEKEYNVQQEHEAKQKAEVEVTRGRLICVGVTVGGCVLMMVVMVFRCVLIVVVGVTVCGCVLIVGVGYGCVGVGGC
eukprot:m.216265 g.216265  ORF g.216265 m.216265 type:complete len:243 (+) comp19115_c0_seq5:353-1081(+)